MPSWLREHNLSAKVATVAMQNGTHGLISLWEAGIRSRDVWSRACEHLESIESPAALLVRHVYARFAGSLIGAGRGAKADTRLMTKTVAVQRHFNGGLFVAVSLGQWFPGLEKGDKMVVECTNGVIRVVPLEWKSSDIAP